MFKWYLTPKQIKCSLSHQNRWVISQNGTGGGGGGWRSRSRPRHKLKCLETIKKRINPMKLICKASTGGTSHHTPRVRGPFATLAGSWIMEVLWPLIYVQVVVGNWFRFSDQTNIGLQFSSLSSKLHLGTTGGVLTHSPLDILDCIAVKCDVTAQRWF